jgi:hypothetical protein
MTEQEPNGQPQESGASPTDLPRAELPTAPLEPTPARADKPGAEPSPSVAQASLEPTAASVTPTTPVKTIAPDKRPSRARWAIAAGIALLVVALSGVGLYALVGAASSSVVASWSPVDALVYVEVRGDLPGDQRQNLGRFLAHFPGFADQSTLDTKIDETLDRLVDKTSDGKHNWSKEIKPWFGGQVAVSLSSFPKLTVGGSPGSMDDLHFLLVATQKDPAAAVAWLKSLSSDASTEQVYKDVTLTVYTNEHGPKVAAGASGGVLLVGDEASVKAAVDRNGKDGLATAKTFTSAMSSLSGDQLTRTYIDLQGYFDAIKAIPGFSLFGVTGLDQTMLSRLPAWAAAGGRVESDALVGEFVAPLAADAPVVADQESAIAKHVPASTVLLLDGQDYGKLLAAQLGELRKQPTLADPLKQVDQVAGALGGLDKLIGWVDEVGVVVTADGATPGGGVVIVPTDVDQATQLATSIRNLIALAGGSSGITIRDEPYGSGTITTIDLGEASRFGTQGDVSILPNLPVSGHVEISFTVQDGLVIVGAGPAWVKSIVDVKPGSSLADQARYRAAMDRVGARNAASFYLDISAIRKLIEPLAAGQPGSNYATDVKPYLEPFDILAGASRTSDGKTVSRYILTVTNPQ